MRGLALALIALLASCIQAPFGPQVPFDYAHVGLPLSASEVVVLFVSTELSPRDLREQDARVSPIAGPPSVLEQIATGFHALPSGLRIVTGDEPLRRACIDTGTQHALRNLADAIVLVPDTNAAACRALIDQRSIRYFVSVAGYRWSGPRVGQQWANTAYGWEAPLVYVLAAQVFDAKNGAVVCDASDVEQATSSVGFLWLYLPFPVFSVVDESAYWQRRAWNIGNKLRGCFLPRAASDSNR